MPRKTSNLKTSEKRIPNTLDLSDVLADFEGKWVILSSDLKRVLASADAPEELGEKTDQGIVYKVSSFSSTYSPFADRR